MSVKIERHVQTQPPLANTHPVLSAIYQARGIQSSDEINHELKALLPYHSLKDIDKAASIIADSIERQERILIVGDFDADGVPMRSPKAYYCKSSVNLNRIKPSPWGMRQRSIIRYRRLRWTFGTEMDGFNCRLRDYVALGVDQPGLSQTGRMVARQVADKDDIGDLIELSEEIEWQESGNHYLLLRRPDGSGWGPYPVLPGLDNRTLRLTRKLDFIPVLNGKMEPPLYQFGASLEEVTIAAKIKKVTPRGTDKTRIEAEEDHPLVYAYDDAVAPAA